MSVEVNNAMVLNNDVANFDGTKIKMPMVQYSDVYSLHYTIYSKNEQKEVNGGN